MDVHSQVIQYTGEVIECIEPFVTIVDKLNKIISLNMNKVISYEVCEK